MDLFDYMRENQKDDDSPLAKRMRPESLDEVVGQEHIIGKEKLLYRAIKADKLSSLIFYGPPGTGKTLLLLSLELTERLHFWLRTAGNRKNDACHGDRTYDKGGFQADQCNNLR